MPSPFPGMDPFLENPQIWSEVHHWLISVIAAELVSKVRPKYMVKIDQRIYQINTNNGNESLLIGIPDVTIKGEKINKFQTPEKTLSKVAVLEPKTEVEPLTVMLPVLEEVRQSYLQIIDLQENQIVTVIEILSPVNKKNSEGRKKYLKKRETILKSSTHFIEIDLLRDGEKMPFLDLDIEFDYLVLVSPSEQRPQASLYGINLPQILPTIPIPLKSKDENVTINLQKILNIIYERAGYDYSIDYTREIVPPLNEKYLNWCEEILCRLG